MTCSHSCNEGRNCPNRKPVKWLVALLMLLGLARAEAFDSWNITDEVLAGTAATAFVIDWRQTQSIARDPARWQELNPLLGSHPSVGAVNRHFALNGLLVGGIAEVLPHTYRDLYLGGVTITEGAFVRHNYKIGLRFAF